MMTAREMLDRARELRRNGDGAAAEITYSDAADLARTEQLAPLRAHALRHVSELASERGAADRAVDAAEEAVAIYESEPEHAPLDLANAYRVRALAFGSAGRRQEAVNDWRRARQLYAQLGVAAGIAECDARLETL